MLFKIPVLISLIALCGMLRPTAHENPTHFIPPIKNAKLVSFGYNEIHADSLWIRVIQDIDVCDQWHSKDPKEWPANGAPKCTKGWVYEMLEAATDLAPKFHVMYVAGATMLSVLVDDHEGAGIIYEKGVKQFPQDGYLAYLAAEHMLNRGNNPQRAAELLVQAGRAGGAPPWVFALAGQLYSKLGKALYARSVLEDALKMNHDGPGANRIQYRLNLINKEIAEEQARAAAAPSTGTK